MAVKHNTTNGQHQEHCEGGSPGAAGGGGCVYEVLEAAQYLTLVGGLVKVDGYFCQEEAQDKVVNEQAEGWLQWSASIRVKVDGKINMWYLNCIKLQQTILN